MKLTDALLGEHAVLYALFDHLRDTVHKSDDIGDILGAVAAVEKTLISHALIEEELLFRRLEPHLGEMGPLSMMRHEHGALEDFFEAARGETGVAALKSAAGRFLGLAHDHFQKEEMVLFPMARQCLDEATLTELGDQWAASRKVVIDGQGCG